MPRDARGRQSLWLSMAGVLEDMENAIASRKARMAAGAALALALDGASFGWALSNLSGALSWATLVVSAGVMFGATVGIAVVTARLDRRLSRVRHLRRLAELVTIR